MLGFDLQTLISNLIPNLIIMVIALTVHEFAHAATANYFGDDLPRQTGRLTLNPLAHLDPVGSLVFIIAGFGWAKPVQVTPWVLQRRSPAALMWVSLAGPFSNLILAILGAVPFRIGLISVNSITSEGTLGILPSLPYFMFLFVVTNMLLAFFNLIPLAPLDGEKIADYFLPPNLARILDQIRPFSVLILMAIVFLLPRLGIDIFGPVYSITYLLIGW